MIYFINFFCTKIITNVLNFLVSFFFSLLEKQVLACDTYVTAKHQKYVFDALTMLKIFFGKYSNGSKGKFRMSWKMWIHSKIWWGKDTVYNHKGVQDSKHTLKVIYGLTKKMYEDNGQELLKTWFEEFGCRFKKAEIKKALKSAGVNVDSGFWSDW